MIIKNTVSFITLIVIPTYFLIEGKESSAMISGAGGFLLSCFLNLDKFSRFKASQDGVEAELKSVITKAYATIEDLKKLASNLIKTQIWFLTNAGRWGALDFVEKHNVKEELIELAKHINILENNQIADSLKEFKSTHEKDMLDILRQKIIKQMGRDIEKKAYSIVAHSSDNNEKQTTPQELRDILKSIDDIDEKFLSLADDYDEYTKSGKLNNPDHWKRNS